MTGQDQAPRLSAATGSLVPALLEHLCVCMGMGQHSRAGQLPTRSLTGPTDPWLLAATSLS